MRQPCTAGDLSSLIEGGQRFCNRHGDPRQLTYLISHAANTSGGSSASERPLLL